MSQPHRWVLSCVISYVTSALVAHKGKFQQQASLFHFARHRKGPFCAGWFPYCPLRHPLRLPALSDSFHADHSSCGREVGWKLLRKTHSHKYLHFCRSYGWRISWIGIESAVHSGHAGTFNRHAYRRFARASHVHPKRGVGSWQQSGDGRAVVKEFELAGQEYNDAGDRTKQVHFEGKHCHSTWHVMTIDST